MTTVHFEDGTSVSGRVSTLPDGGFMCESVVTYGHGELTLFTEYRMMVRHES
jgi:hypothetical protein